MIWSCCTSTDVIIPFKFERFWLINFFKIIGDIRNLSYRNKINWMSIKRFRCIGWNKFILLMLVIWRDVQDIIYHISGTLGWVLIIGRRGWLLSLFRFLAFNELYCKWRISNRFIWIIRVSTLSFNFKLSWMLLLLIMNLLLIKPCWTYLLNNLILFFGHESMDFWGIDGWSLKWICNEFEIILWVRLIRWSIRN